jgi:peptidoglycan/LPS O-acetylase OafA/YrhL
MVWLGEISFAFYLVHQLAIRLVTHAFGSRAVPDATGMLLATAMLAVALVGSWALYRVVERPMMTRLAGSRRPAPAAAPREAPATLS